MFGSFPAGTPEHEEQQKLWAEREKRTKRIEKAEKIAEAKAYEARVLKEAKHAIAVQKKINELKEIDAEKKRAKMIAIISQRKPVS